MHAFRNYYLCRSVSERNLLTIPMVAGSPGMSPSGDDDPAPFEAELRAREARLGPSHPDVAEALSNLAIIHNQVCYQWCCFKWAW